MCYINDDINSYCLVCCYYPAVMIMINKYVIKPVALVISFTVQSQTDLKALCSSLEGGAENTKYQEALHTQNIMFLPMALENLVDRS